MKHSIILEGPNGSGKSTLAKVLGEEFDLPVIHAGPSPGNDNDAIAACFKQAKSLYGGCIMDRCTPISRQIYETPLSSEHIEDLGMWLDGMESLSIIVYCTGAGPFINKDYYPPGHYEEVVERREQIRDLYDSLMETVPCIKYNWEHDTLIWALMRIKNEFYTAVHG